MRIPSPTPHMVAGWIRDQSWLLIFVHLSRHKQQFLSVWKYDRMEVDEIENMTPMKESPTYISRKLQLLYRCVNSAIRTPTNCTILTGIVYVGAQS